VRRLPHQEQPTADEDESRPLKPSPKMVKRLAWSVTSQDIASSSSTRITSASPSPSRRASG
jgi:hypothetical protein